MALPDDIEICEPHFVDEEKIRCWKARLPSMGYVVSIFKVMSDETRASILYLLSQETWCVHDLAACLGASVSNVSHHLRLLKAARLVKARRDGQRVFYSLDDEHVVGLLEEAFKHATHQ